MDITLNESWIRPDKLRNIPYLLWQRPEKKWEVTKTKQWRGHMSRYQWGVRDESTFSNLFQVQAWEPGNSFSIGRTLQRDFSVPKFSWQDSQDTTLIKMYFMTSLMSLTLSFSKKKMVYKTSPRGKQMTDKRFYKKLINRQTYSTFPINSLVLTSSYMVLCSPHLSGLKILAPEPWSQAIELFRERLKVRPKNQVWGSGNIVWFHKKT